MSGGALLSPTVRAFGRPFLAFHVAGWAGLVAGVALGLTVVVLTGRSPVVLVVLAAVAVATFLALAALTKAVTGRESLTYYHHQFAILLVVWAVLATAGHPILPYLDATAIGVGAFLAIGRFGCLMAGCCYGRPSSHGVRYTPEHARAGFPAELVGVRLLPVQVMESAWVFGVVGVGIALAVAGGPPGLALAWYVELHAVGRFMLELARGDPERAFLGGLSEAQWTSLATAIGVAFAAAVGVLPWSPWQPVLAAALALAAVGLAIRHGLDPVARLSRASHVLEIASALPVQTVPDRTGAIRVTATSEGLRLSAERLSGLLLVAMSRPGRPLSPGEVRGLSKSIATLCGSGHDRQTIKGRNGVVHLLLAYDPGRRTKAAGAIPETSRAV